MEFAIFTKYIYVCYGINVQTAAPAFTKCLRFVNFTTSVCGSFKSLCNGPIMPLA